MDIKRVFYFVETARYGSFTQAAEKLFVTPQALSKAISLLEREYDVELFIRRNNQIILSETGQQILPVAKELLECYSGFEKYLQRLSQLEHGYFHVAVAQNVLTLLDVNLFANFTQEYPEVNPEYLELPDKIVEEYIENDRVDLCFNINLLPNQEKYNSILLLRTELCVFESEKNWSFGDKKYVTLEDLQNKKIVMQGEGYKVFENLKEAAKAQEIALNYELKTADTALVVDKLTLPGNISVAPYALYNVLEHNSHYKAVPLRPTLPWNIYLSYKKGKPLSKSLRQFVNFVIDKYSGIRVEFDS